MFKEKKHIGKHEKKTQKLEFPAKNPLVSRFSKYARILFFAGSLSTTACAGYYIQPQRYSGAHVAQEDDNSRVGKLINALRNKKENVRKNAAEALVDAAYNGEDLSPAIPALGSALSDENLDVRRNAALALMNIAEKGQDITLAIPALINALDDENLDVRRNAALALMNIAGKNLGMDITSAISVLVDALRYDENKYFRRSICDALGNAAHNGRDITPAIPALGNALYDEDYGVKVSAVSALKEAVLKNLDITPAILPLINTSLSNEDHDITREVIWILVIAAEKGQDITLAIPALATALNNEAEDLKMVVAEALEESAFYGIDTSPAIPALIKALDNKDSDIRNNAARALTSFYINKKEWKKVEEMLMHENKDIRSGAAWTVAKAASYNEDITTIISTFAKALEDKDLDIKDIAARALTSFYINKKEWKKVEEMLMHENKDIRSGAAEALVDAAYIGKDITPAIRTTLINALDNKDSDIRNNAARALTSFYINKKEWKKVEEMLMHENKDIRSGAAWTVAKAASYNEDITTIISTFAKALEDKDLDIKDIAARALTSFYINKKEWKKVEEMLMHENKDIRSGAAEALVDAAYIGKDITPAIPALIEALNDESEKVKRSAAKVLPNFHENKEWKKVEEMLEDPSAKLNTVLALRNAAYLGKEIIPILSALVDIINNTEERGVIRKHASAALASFCFEYANKYKGETLKQLERLRKELYERSIKDRDVREGIEEANEYYNNLFKAMKGK